MKSAKVVFHVSGRFVENYMSRPHLKLFAQIKKLLDERGGEVEVRRRAERLRDPDATSWSDLLEPENLHIVENGVVNQPNTLNTTLAYLQGFYHLDPQGVLANSSIAQADYQPLMQDARRAALFWDDLQNRFVRRRYSRYNQPHDITEVPQGSIAVFLQGEFPHKQRTAYCDSEAMLRAVIKSSGGRPVIVKGHPSSDIRKESQMIHKLLSEGLPLHPTDANIHDILNKCALTVSFNSAVSIEGFLHHKPTVLFGKSDFHHACETVVSPADFPSAMMRALESSHDYQDYLYWYFSTFCFCVTDVNLSEKLLKRFDQSGFSEKRLGLSRWTKSNFLDRAARQIEAERALAKILEEKTEVQNFKLLKPLKVSGKGWVFSAMINGEKVVVKRFLGNAYMRTTQSLKSELDYLETVFTDEKFQVNRCIFAWPESGVVVLSFAPGMRLGDQISISSGEARHRLLKQSGEWLQKYCAARSRDRTFGPRYWVDRLASKPLDHISSKDDRMLLERLLMQLRSQVGRVRGVSVVQAATHGDFVGINAHFHKGTIYGVDIQGESWLAVAKEVARFMVWTQIHDSSRPQSRRYGICEKDLDSFLSSQILSSEEQTTTLPFFIGADFYSRFVEEYSRREIRDNTRSAIECYLGDF